MMLQCLAALCHTLMELMLFTIVTPRVSDPLIEMPAFPFAKHLLRMPKSKMIICQFQDNLHGKQGNCCTCLMQRLESVSISSQLQAVRVDLGFNLGPHGNVDMDDSRHFTAVPPKRGYRCQMLEGKDQQKHAQGGTTQVK